MQSLLKRVPHANVTFLGTHNRYAIKSPPTICMVQTLSILLPISYFPTLLLDVLQGKGKEADLESKCRRMLSFPPPYV